MQPDVQRAQPMRTDAGTVEAAPELERRAAFYGERVLLPTAAAARSRRGSKAQPEQ